MTKKTAPFEYLKPKKIQEHPELWCWDYVEPNNKTKGGFGLMLCRASGECDLLHFNEWWNEHNEWQAQPLNNRDYLLRQSCFKLIAELK